MEKRGSDLQNRSITEWQHKKPYKKLSEDLNEWFSIYREGTNSPSMISIIALRKYRLILKSLKKDFGNDPDMAKYIKKLPRAWMITPKLIEIVLVFCIILIILFFITNELFFKIHTGILISDRFGGGKSDIIYMIMAILLAFVLILLLRKRIRVYIVLEENLLQIRRIAVTKS